VNFAGTQTIAVPIETVWDFLMDPHQVGPCMPGFQAVEVIDPQTFKVRVRVGIAAVKATFTMDVRMVELEPPTRATGKAHGMAPGSAVDVTSAMSLSEAGDGMTTTMQWSADVAVSGTPASLGACLLHSTAQKMTAQFFTCVQEKLEAPSA
jgi:carbon monoxide dehydrogenase subunit G